MIDLAVYDLNKYYGANHVLKGITFEVYSGEKIGLLGKNGSGKTTLFKVMTGEQPYESGSVSKASGKKIEMLAQIPAFEPNDTAEHILRSAFKEITDVFNELKKIEGDQNPAAIAKYGRLMERYELLGGYDMEVKLEKVCAGINIDQNMRKSLFGQLSGGEKTRLNLARILLRECDILLLDEPTNHLDLASLQWLEKFLRSFEGTVIVVSHDRVFVDNVVERIVEIDDGKANFYKGNYSYYVEEKQQRFLTQSEQYQQQRKKIRQLQAAAKRLHDWGRQGDNEALHKRAFAIEKRIEKMDKVEKPVVDKKLTATFESGGYAAKEIVAFNSVSKSYETKVLLNNLNLKIYRNDRIALVGANGCGKTTMLKMMMGEQQCDDGEIKTSVNVKPAYMPQIITFENNDATILDTLQSQTALPAQKARNILAAFHFRADDVNKKVSSLSGGQKSRLKLCLMMQNDVNFLLLDEPTNHLDIASREWIENVLTDFEGTMLFVSHDRYFLNKFADKVWSIDANDGRIVEHPFGFEQYMHWIDSNTDSAQTKTKSRPPKKLKPKQNDAPLKQVSTEHLISQAENELEKINAELNSCLSKSDFLQAEQLYHAKNQLEHKIELLYAEWFEQS